MKLSCGIRTLPIRTLFSRLSYHCGRRVRLVVHPTEPLRGDHGAVVLDVVLLVVDDPAILACKRRHVKLQFYLQSIELFIDRFEAALFLTHT